MGTQGMRDGQTPGNCCRGHPREPPPVPQLLSITHSHWMAMASPSWQSSTAAVSTASRPMAGDGTGSRAVSRASAPFIPSGLRPAHWGGEQRQFWCHSQLTAVGGGWSGHPHCLALVPSLGSPGVGSHWSGTPLLLRSVAPEIVAPWGAQSSLVQRDITFSCSRRAICLQSKHTLLFSADKNLSP